MAPAVFFAYQAAIGPSIPTPLYGLAAFALAIVVLICLGYIGTWTLKQRFDSETATALAGYDPEATAYIIINTAVAATATAKKLWTATPTP